jgi:hypothetical protein
MPQTPYNTKVSNWLTDAILAAKRKLREKVPTQGQFEEETRSIVRDDPDYLEARKPFEFTKTHNLGVAPDTGNPVLDMLLDPTNLTPIGAGALVGGAGRFGDMGKKAKQLLKEWHGLGLKDLTIEHAMKYLQTPAKDLMLGNVDHAIASRIAEAGGNPLKHVANEEIESVLKEAGYMDFGPNKPPSGQSGSGRTTDQPWVDEFLTNDAVDNDFPLNPGLEDQIPTVDVPRTPQEFDDFHASIPDPRAGLDQIPPTPGSVPGAEFNPQTMVDQRAYDAPRSQTRPGRGRRQEDLDYTQAYQMIQEAMQSGVPPDEIVKELEKAGLKPEDYADMFGQADLAGAPPIGGLTRPEPPPGAASQFSPVTPENMIGRIRQQPTPGDDFAGAFTKLLQSTNDWDEAVKQTVIHTKKQNIPKEEVVNKLMDAFGHENPQLSTLVNKYWQD